MCGQAVGLLERGSAMRGVGSRCRYGEGGSGGLISFLIS